MRTGARGALLALVTLIILSAPGAASAELPSPFGETRGFVIEGAFGVNGVTDDDWLDDLSFWDIDVGPIVGLELHLAYRPIDYLSIGLLTHFGFLNAEGDNMNSELGAFLGLLAEVRGHLPMGRFDPFVGFGFGYAMAFAKAEDLGAPFFPPAEGSRASLALHGVGLGVSAGLSVYVTERFALGGFFRMIFGAYVTACWTWDDVPGLGDDDDCDDLEDFYNVDDRDDLPDLPHLWMVGITASYII